MNVEVSKDPAFLFYSSDFYLDTVLWKDEDVGKYIRLLCILHQNGKLTYNEVLSVVKDEKSVIFSKLKIDENGLYYNERLSIEITKRKAYSESRRRNRQNTSKTYVVHMENENVNENINEYVNENNYSNKVKDVIISWLEYKLERKERYKEKGFKSLLTQIKNKIDIFGEDAIIDVIEKSMASNYKGIIFDKLQQSVSQKTYTERRMSAQEEEKQKFLNGESL